MKIKQMLLMFMVCLLATSTIKWLDQKQIKDLRIYADMQSDANTSLLKHYNSVIEDYNKKLKAKDEQINNLQSQIDSSKNIWIPVEVSYYSSQEKTDVAKYSDMNATGGYLQSGDYSAPDILPLGTVFAIKYNDGHSEIGTVKDRGALWAIKVYNRNDNPTIKGATMRLDKYVTNVKGKGVDAAAIQILKWGDK